jgi:hypothetical protein
MCIYNYDETKCLDLLRMKMTPFFQLCGLLCTRQLLRDSINNTVEDQVIMFLHVVEHNKCFRVIGLSFRRSTETITRFFHEVLCVVGELRNEMINPRLCYPIQNSTQPNVEPIFQRLCKCNRCHSCASSSAN